MERIQQVVVQSLNRVRLFVTPWTVTHQAPLSMGFSRQGYWSGLPFPPPGNLPDPGIEPVSPASPSLAGRLFTSEATGEVPLIHDMEAKRLLCSLPVISHMHGNTCHVSYLVGREPCRETGIATRFLYLVSSHLPS